jgi:hypothetical protein
MKNISISGVNAFLIIFLSLWQTGESEAQQLPDYKNPDHPVEKRMADLSDRMTLEDKCYQFTGKFKRTPQMKIGTYFPVSTAMAATWYVHKKQWTVEPGKFEILLGGSSADIRPAKIVEL